MQRIEVLVDQQELILVMKPEEVGTWLEERRENAFRISKPELGKALGLKSRTQIYNLLAGGPFKKKQIERYNQMDSDFQLVQLVGVVRKKEVLA